MPALSVLVLSEDSSPSAHDTIAALARKMLQLVDQHTATHRIRFQPTNARHAVRANIWQSKKPHPQLVDLKREIARKILEDDVPGYVFFHCDGDRPWAENARSENAMKFEIFRQGLRPLIEKNLRDRKLISESDDANAIVNERLNRICRITPFYSIEAWLYQDTPRIRALCQQSCGRHVELIDRWETNRSLLDEVVKPVLPRPSRGATRHLGPYASNNE